MADVQETNNRLSFKLEMRRGASENGARTMSFDLPADFDQLPAKYTQVARSIATSLVADSVSGGFNTFFQPTGWRDSDDEEDVWTTVRVTPVITVTTNTSLEAATAGE